MDSIAPMFLLRRAAVLWLLSGVFQAELGWAASAPAAPAGLTATSGTAQVALSWPASTGATKYNVKRSTVSGSAYAAVSTVTTTAFTDTPTTKLVPGVTYYYVVSAANTAGESANSIVASGKATLGAPASLTATAGAAQVALSWKASTGATKYNVKRSTVNGSGYATVGSPTTTTFTDTATTGLVPGTAYFYVVTAVDTAVESANSVQASATPVFAAPTSLTASAGTAQVSLAWKASTGATKYNLKRSTTNGSGYATVATLTTLSYTDTSASGLVAGATAYYVVTGVNASGGESAASAQASAKPLFAAPTGLKATAGSAQVSLTWTASAGATKYNVKRSTTSGAGFATVATPTTASFTDTPTTGLVPAATYYYVVSAVDSLAESANSAQASAKPTFAAPTGLTAAPGLGQIALTWTASAGATKYNVKRSKTSGSGFATIASPTATAFTDSSATGLASATTYYYVVTAVDAAGESANSAQASGTAAASSTSIAVTVNVLGNRHAISPFIYGANFPPTAAYITTGGVTLSRWGGNSSSRYNWKLNVTNTANDWYFENSTWGSSGFGSNSATFVSSVANAGGSPIMTIPMLPWVAKDGTSYSFSVKKYGKQCKTDPYDPPSSLERGDGILPNCSADLTGNDPKDAHVELHDSPSSGDATGSVYRSEWIAALAPKFGMQPHVYDLDNECDIWGGTHRDVHPSPTGYDELAAAIVKEGHAVLSFDPKAIRLAPVSCCWWFYWNGANGNDKGAHGNLDFLPWLLNEILYNDVVAGTRSFDVFDVHAYFNGPDGSKLTSAQRQAAALRQTRDWWDASYISESGTVNQTYATQIEPSRTVGFVIPRMRAMANSIYPGAPVSFTEWNGAMAGETDFSTALVDADAYGILGRERMWGATRWVAADANSPAYQALVLYRNADGSHNGFQSVSVQATNSGDPNLFSAYAAMNTAGDALTLMVVNKSPANQASVSFDVAGFTPTTMKTYTLSQSKPTAIVAGGSQSWTGTQSFAPYSATLIVASGKTATAPTSEWDLNPDTLLANTSSTVTISPIITSGTGSVTLTSATGTGGLNLTLTQPKLPPVNSASPIAAVITIATPSTPGLYSFTVTGTDSGGATETQQGWVLVTVPAAKLTKTGDNQTAAKGAKVTLTATFVPGSSGATAGNVDLLFTTSAGALNSRIVRTDSNGNATVTLTLPASAGPVTVTAVGPVFWGTPLATFTVTAQ